MATIRDVASLSGVSVGTVSRYLNGIKIRDDNAQAIAKAIEKLDYYPSIFGRALTKQRSLAIGILVADTGNVFSSTIIGGLESEFEERGYTSLFVDFHRDVEVLKEKARFLMSRKVEGLVVFLSEVDVSGLGFLGDLDIPVVVVDNPLESPRVDSVVVDNATATEQVVLAMLDEGHRRVGVIAPDQRTYVGQTRLQGWKDAFAARGLSLQEEDIRVCGPSKLASYEAACSLLDAGHITALFTCNYYAALGAIKVLNERGLAPGADIGFASFDDFDFSDVMNPALTVVHQPMGEIVEHVARIMSDRLDRGEVAAGIHMLRSSVVLTDSIRGRGLSDG